MKETIEKFIEEIYGTHEFASVSKDLLRKMLLTLNPMKIDEERMATCFEEVFTKDIYAKSNFKTIVDKYNSTLEDHQCKYCKAMTSQPDEECYLAPQVLQPLPKDKPDWFEWSLDTSKYDLWDELVKTYGTPTKKELVSVEELEKEIYDSTVNLNDNECKVLAKSLVNKYGLNPPKREWWMDCEKFMYKGRVYKKYSYEIFPDGHTVLHAELSRHDLKDCTPYIEPSIHDKVKEKLGTELYEEFMKEVKG